MLRKTGIKIKKGDIAKCMASETDEQDDFLHAMGDNQELHIDFAHSISIGKDKEKYYLVFVVGGVNFLWAAPTKTVASPEDLVAKFLAESKLKIGKIRCDGAFDTSAFRAFCKRRDITLCAATAYNHTMQARAEGAVRICKDHVRCLLKASNLPPRFWPYALMHFSRTFNHWPSAEAPPLWTKMEGTNLVFDRARDLVVWGCYMTVHLPTEHPLVQQDKTHADRALEGAFLGWHATTPAAWMYSFRLDKVVRVSDPTFHKQDFPFLDPTILVNPGHLTDDQVVAMHQQDAEFAAQSQASTQQQDIQEIEKSKTGGGRKNLSNNAKQRTCHRRRGRIFKV